MATLLQGQEVAPCASDTKSSARAAAGRLRKPQACTDPVLRVLTGEIDELARSLSPERKQTARPWSSPQPRSAAAPAPRAGRKPARITSWMLQGTRPQAPGDVQLSTACTDMPIEDTNGSARASATPRTTGHDECAQAAVTALARNTSLAATVRVTVPRPAEPAPVAATAAGSDLLCRPCATLETCRLPRARPC